MNRKMVEPTISKLRHREVVFPSGQRAELWLERSGSHIQMHKIRPNSSGARNWKKCQEDGCYGQAVRPYGKCVGHLTINEREQHFEFVRQTEDTLYLCGVEVDQELLDSVIRLLAKDGTVIRKMISFEGAEIKAQIRLYGYTFEKEINFTGATFYKSAEFDHCVFARGFFGQFIRLAGSAIDLKQSRIESRDFDVSYSSCDLNGIRINNCEFAGNVRADGNALKAFRLEESTVMGNLSINDANSVFIFLTGTSIEGECRIENTKCSTLRAQRVRIASAHHIGPISIQHNCEFNYARFLSSGALDIQADVLNLENAQFIAGGNIFVEQSKIILRHFNAGRMIRICGRPSNSRIPEILDINGADAGLLSFANVDMSRCIFYGAHNLSRIIIEPTVRFALSPTWPRKRKCIADEFTWRIRRGWLSSRIWVNACALIQTQNTSTSRPVLQPSQIAMTYRELRRSFESNSYEPGGADFYYGEMEMRRYSRDASFLERLIVTLYWVVSGYGLREVRPLIFFGLLVWLGGYTASVWGFEAGPVSIRDGLLFSLNAIVSVFPGQRISWPECLTWIGRTIGIGVTVLGTFLLALFALAVRNRVKRR